MLEMPLLCNWGTKRVCLARSQPYPAQPLPLQEEDQCEVGQSLPSTPADGCSVFQTMFPQPLIPVASPDKQAKMTDSKKLVRSSRELLDKSITKEGRTERTINNV